MSSKNDTSMFISVQANIFLVVLVYVDDILAIGNNTTTIANLVKILDSQFALKDLRPIHYFLGVQVHRDKIGLHLHQTKYINDLLHRATMTNCKPVSSPMSSTASALSIHDGKLFEDRTEYRSIVGALHYYTLTKPNIAYVVNRA